MEIEAIRAIVSALQGAAPADWSARHGVICPVCGADLYPGRSGVLKTTGWIGDVRERYHGCPVCGARFKSVESCPP